MSDALPTDLIAVGRVVDAYGVHGWVKILPYNVPTESVLRSCRRWWLPDGRAVDVDRARVHGAMRSASPMLCARQVPDTSYGCARMHSTR